MMDERSAFALLEGALAGASSDDIELGLHLTTAATTRFANNVITQNVETREGELSVRVSFGRSSGSASTASLDEESVAAAVRRAEAIARVMPADPEWLPSLGPQDYLEIPTFVPASRAFGPEDRAEAARGMVELARSKRVELAGSITTTARTSVLATSNGLRAFNESVSVDASCTADAGDDGTGWAENGHRDVAEVDFRGLARHACDRALAAARPMEVDAGDWTVILEPPALTGLLSYMLWFWNARDTYAGRTFLSGKVGEAIVGENITLRSEPADPALLASPFDWRGIPVRARTWIERGRVVDFYHDRWTAKEKGIEPTPWPSGLVLDGGHKTREALISETERGLLVSRFWYIRSVDPMQLLLTGMTRNGTFLIEDGRITGAVRNLRFNESTLGALSRVEAMTPAVPAGQTESQRMRVPTTRIRDFHFDSVTRF